MTNGGLNKDFTFVSGVHDIYRILALRARCSTDSFMKVLLRTCYKHQTITTGTYLITGHTFTGKEIATLNDIPIDVDGHRLKAVSPNMRLTVPTLTSGAVAYLEIEYQSGDWR